MKKVWVGALTLALAATSINIGHANETTEPTPAAVQVLITDHGAVAGDEIDDTAAIQKAIHAASALGGGEVVVPNGVFLVAPTTTKRIEVPSNITITGVGTLGESVLKVKNDAGDYLTVFGAPMSTSAYVEHVKFQYLRFDQNPAGNTTGYLKSGVSGIGQHMIAFYNFYNVTVDNVRFDPISGINTVVLNGPTAKKATVTNNTFKFVRGRGADRYDNSAVYLNCEDQTLTGNTFTADLSEKAFGAMETHKGPSVVQNNVTDGYQTLLHVVSPSSGQSVLHPSMEVAYNTAKRANHAIRLWSITGTLLKNVNIHDNMIDVAQADHKEVSSSGISMVHSAGESLKGLQDGIAIHHNSITFQQAPVGIDITESSSYGIGLAPSGNISNVTVTDNTVNNAPVRGLLLGNYTTTNSSEHVTITGNTFLNPGHDLGAQESYRAGMAIVSTQHDVTVTGNTIHGDLNPFRGNYSFYVQNGTFTGVTVKDNTVKADYGTYKTSIHATVMR